MFQKLVNRSRLKHYKVKKNGHNYFTKSQLEKIIQEKKYKLEETKAIMLESLSWQETREIVQTRAMQETTNHNHGNTTNDTRSVGMKEQMNKKCYIESPQCISMKPPSARW